MAKKQKDQQWEVEKSLENKYNLQIINATRKIWDQVKGMDNLKDIQKAMEAFYDSKAMDRISNGIASQFAVNVNKVNAKTWRQAALASGKGRVIADTLFKTVINSSDVGKAMKAIVKNNANLIKTLPLDVSKEITKFVGTKTFQGSRSSDIAAMLQDKIKDYTKAKASLIARTESSKAMTALTEARSRDLGVHWYIWRTANDGLRVRKGHREMQNVIVNYDDPPAPEELVGEKSAGHYHAGNIYNCRCFPRPIISLTSVTWPSKVYYNGTIATMSKMEFEALNNKMYPKVIQTPTPVAPVIQAPAVAVQAAQPKIHKPISKEELKSAVFVVTVDDNFTNFVGLAFEHAKSEGKDPYEVVIQKLEKYKNNSNDNSEKEQLDDLIERFSTMAGNTPPEQEPEPKSVSTNFEYDGSAKSLGGAGDKSFYSRNGKKYLFKPAVTKGGSTAEYKAFIQEAAYKIQKEVSGDLSVPVEIAKLEGKVGTIQPLVEIDQSADQDALLNWQKGYSKNIPKKWIEQLQNEHVTDWVLGNYDAHGKNFLINPQGDLVGIDKEQCFAYIKETGSNQLSTMYHPNSKFGENPPIYNKLFDDYVKGNIDLDFNAPLEAIKKIEAMNDQDYREMFKGYAESLYPYDSIEQNKLLDSILLKKQTLRQAYKDFYSLLLKQKTGKDYTWNFKDEDKPGVHLKKLVQQTVTQSKPSTQTTSASSGGWSEIPIEYNKFQILTKNSTLQQKVVNEHTNYIEALDQSKKRAIKAYTGSAYDEMNTALRNDELNDSSKYNDTTRDRVKHLKMALEKSPELPEDIKTYRRVYTDALRTMFDDKVYSIAKDYANGNISENDAKAELEKRMINTVTYDKGFMSTTYKEGAFGSGKPVQFEMYFPQGFKGGSFVENISNYNSEKEYIVNASTQFVVTGVELKSNRIHVHLVPKDYIDLDKKQFTKVKNNGKINSKSTAQTIDPVSSGNWIKVKVGIYEYNAQDFGDYILLNSKKLKTYKNTKGRYFIQYNKAIYLKEAI